MTLFLELTPLLFTQTSSGIGPAIKWHLKQSIKSAMHCLDQSTKRESFTGRKLDEFHCHVIDSTAGSLQGFVNQNLRISRQSRCLFERGLVRRDRRLGAEMPLRDRRTARAEIAPPRRGASLRSRFRSMSGRNQNIRAGQRVMRVFGGYLGSVLSSFHSFLASLRP